MAQGHHQCLKTDALSKLYFETAAKLNCIEDSYKIPLLDSASMLAKACNSVEKKLLSTVPGRLDS
jgi:hypothetical protein